MARFLSFRKKISPKTVDLNSQNMKGFSFSYTSCRKNFPIISRSLFGCLLLTLQQKTAEKTIVIKD